MQKQLFSRKLLLILLCLSFFTAGYFFTTGKEHRGIPNSTSKLSQDNSISEDTDAKLEAPVQIISPKSIQQTIILGGDIMLSRAIGMRNKKDGYDRIFTGENYHPLSAINECKLGDCILVANLESPFSLKDLDTGNTGMLFRANTGNIAVLTGLRMGNTLLLNLANNHMNNAGGAGIATTVELLDNHNIYHFGAGVSSENASKILVYTGNGIQFCFAGYSYDGNGGRYGGLPLYRNKINLTGMLADLSTMKSQLRCEVSIMVVHRGSEYKINPNKTQIEQAHTLIDNGLDLLVGGHSHIPGKIEVYNGKYIFYSLGNALFDQDWGMSTNSSSMDTIYDNLLQKNTVPTYINIRPELLVSKTDIGSTISLKDIHMTRIEKGVYTPLDSETKNNVLQTIYPPLE